MNDLVMRLRGSLWWLLPLVVVVALIGIETDLGRAVYVHPAPEEPIVAKPVVVSLLPEYAIDGGTASHSETVARTLFNPTRRPAPVAAPEVAKPKMQKGQFALTGTTVAGERSLAFLREANGGKAKTVKLGDTVNGMLVAEVKPDRVRLTLADESEELVLKVVANPKPTPQPAHPPGAAPPPAPGMPPLPGQAGQPQPGAPNPQEVGQSLAERRRAARAAEAAASEAAQQQQQQQQPAQAQPVPPPPPAPQGAPTAGTTGQPDAGWAAVFQRYQQRRN